MSRESSTSQGRGALAAQKKTGLLQNIKILDVIVYVLLLIRDLIGGSAWLSKNHKDHVKRLLAIVWPKMTARWGSPEGMGRGEIFGLLMLSVIRTYLMDISSTVMKKLSEAVYGRQAGLFQEHALRALQMAAIGSAVNAAINYCRERLGVLWRSKLTGEIHRQYFMAMNYYYVGTTKKPRAIPDADEVIMREVQSSTTRLVNVVHLLIKSIVPIVWFTFKLIRTNGVAYAMIPHMYLLFAYEVAQRLFPKNIGLLYRALLKAQGSYVSGTTRMQANAEAIAALNGAATEAKILDNAFTKVSAASVELSRTKARHDTIFSIAYTHGCRSWIQSIILLPILNRALAGSSSSVAGLVATAEENSRFMLEMLIGNGSLLTLHATAVHMKPTCGKVCELLDLLAVLSKDTVAVKKSNMKEGNIIKFEGVTVHTPAGQVLVRDLTFDVTPGEGLLLTGHNGAGKSSIFRYLGGLWPLKEGVITKPGVNTDGLCADIFYVPQKPYNVLGTLEDQLAYPLKGKGINREELIKLLVKVDLLHLLDMPTDEETIWDEKLSLGEQQRLAIARLFYHNPKYAILDECTSAVSHSVESMLYEECYKRKITYITICHRPALEAYHSKNLHLEGENSDGGWKVTSLPKPVLTGMSVDIDATVKKSHDTNKPPVAIPRRGFFSKMHQLLRIALPGSVQPTCLLLVTILFRTAMHEVDAFTAGRLIQSALDRNPERFVRFAFLSSAQDLATACLESLIAHLQGAVSAVWADNLANYSRGLFAKNLAFYRLRNVDRRILDADQRLTHEVMELSEQLSTILSKSMLPIANVAWVAYKMPSWMSYDQALPLFGYMAAGSAVVKLMMPDHESLVRAEQKHEAAFRFVHKRVRTHSESIAFFGGGGREKEIAEAHLKKLADAQLSARAKESVFKAVSGWLVKDPDEVSRMVTSGAVFTDFVKLQVVMHQSDINQEVLTAVGKGTTASIDSFGKLASLYTNFAKLSASSTRVCELLDVIHSLPPVADTHTNSPSISFDKTTITTPAGRTLASNISLTVPPGKSLLVTGPNSVGKTSFFRVLAGLWPATGVSRPTNGLSLVPQKLYMVSGTLADQVVYPARAEDMGGDPKLKDKLLEVLRSVGIERLALRERRQIVEIPKDAMSRLVGGKRELEHHCKVKVQADEEKGTVVIRGNASACKEAVKQMRAHGDVSVRVVSDDAVGLEVVEPWENVLSLGEQQRLGIARILFHAPNYAVLDECTDAVSVDVEQKLYSEIQQRGTTCVTISKRLALPEFHAQQLSLGADNEQQWTLRDLEKPAKSS
ncbi:ABC transporter D family member 1 [Diplonema papillatum]|nr:ABC transporter D family member 1 [Diplonema papillatum]